MLKATNKVLSRTSRGRTLLYRASCPSKQKAPWKSEWHSFCIIPTRTVPGSLTVSGLLRLLEQSLLVFIQLFCRIFYGGVCGSTQDLIRMLFYICGAEWSDVLCSPKNRTSLIAAFRTFEFPFNEAFRLPAGYLRFSTCFLADLVHQQARFSMF